MEVTVKLNYLRIAPRKVRQVANLVRGKKTEQAEAMLGFLANKPAKSILKLLKSGIAAAKHDFELEPDNLYISKIFVDEGPKLKRFTPVSRGSAHPLWKRTSHIVLVLGETKPTAKKKTHKKKETKKEKVEEIAKVEKVEAVPKSAVIPEKKPARRSWGPLGDEGGERPKFEKQEEKRQKELGRFKRIFRRKAF